MQFQVAPFFHFVHCQTIATNLVQTVGLWLCHQSGQGGVGDGKRGKCGSIFNVQRLHCSFATPSRTFRLHSILFMAVFLHLANGTRHRAFRIPHLWIEVFCKLFLSFSAL